MIESFHRTLKTAIKARKQAWLTALPIVLLGIRNTVNDSGFSPANAVTGCNLLLPRPMIFPTVTEATHDQVKELAEAMTSIKVLTRQLQATPLGLVF